MMAAATVRSIRRRLQERLVVDANVNRLYVAYRKLRFRPPKCERLSPFTNIYHCCTHKTASTWFKAVLSDELIYKYSGLIGIPYVQLGLRSAKIEHALPSRTIGIHLYIDYDTFCRIPKPVAHRAFFVLRDPRDVVVSWYFYARNTHSTTRSGRADPVAAIRRDLRSMPLVQGLCYMIDRLDDWGSFDAARSWARAARSNPDLAILRYEHLARNERKFLRDLLDHLEIDVPARELDELYERTCYRRQAGGRRQGAEDVHAHFRKGVSGDWQNYFDRTIEVHFRSRAGDLIEELGYAA